MIPITSLPRRFATANKHAHLMTRSVRRIHLPSADVLLSSQLDSIPRPPLCRLNHPICFSRLDSKLSKRNLATLKKSFSRPADALLTGLTEDVVLDESDLIGIRPGSWWSGKAPPVCPGFWNDTQTMSSLPMPNLASCTKQQVLDYFDNTWTLTETLFAALQGSETFVRPPYHGLRHPLIFYYGHPAVFYINKMRLAGLIDDSINPYFETIFETGVDEMRWDDMSKNHMEWPSVSEVYEYRRHVYSTVRQVISGHPDLRDGHRPIDRDHPLWSIFMAFEHERIHIETSSVLIRELPLHCILKPLYWPDLHPSIQDSKIPTPKCGENFPVNAWIEVEAGEALIGKEKRFPSFGWDNEYGSLKVEVESFAASKYKVSNGEFHQFVKDKGYHNQKYWSEEGWKWRCFRNVKWPTFWVRYGPAGLDQFKLRTIFEEVDMPWSWPVDVNYHEAKAFAAWKAEKDGRSEPYRIITEAEHHRIRDEANEDPVMSTSGRMAMDKNMNLNLSYGSESPVNAFPPNSKGFCDVFGNVWEWCEDHFSALPGFEIHPYYDDFSSPCFDGEHHMILGGSFASMGDNGGSKFSRYHFRPHFFQHSGFRLVAADDLHGYVRTSCMDGTGPYAQGSPCCVSDKKSKEKKDKADETALLQGILSHYPSLSKTTHFNFHVLDGLNFPRKAAGHFASMMQRHGTAFNKVLDVGCGPGGVAFSLAQHFLHVDALDVNAKVISVAEKLKKEGSIAVLKGNIDNEEPKFVVVDPIIDRSRVHFKQADAMCLPVHMTDYDGIVISNLLEYISSPGGPLGRLGGPKGMLKKGGLAMIVSTYAWTESRTPRGAWLSDAVGDYSEESKELAVAGLQKALGDGFELIGQEDMPFLAQEDGRTYKLSIPHITVWKRVS